MNAKWIFSILRVFLIVKCSPILHIVYFLCERMNPKRLNWFCFYFVNFRLNNRWCCCFPWNPNACFIFISIFLFNWSEFYIFKSYVRLDPAPELDFVWGSNDNLQSKAFISFWHRHRISCNIWIRRQICDSRFLHYYLHKIQNEYENEENN